MNWSDVSLVVLLVLVVGLPVCAMIAWVVWFRHGVIIKVGDGTQRRFIRYDELREWDED